MVDTNMHLRTSLSLRFAVVVAAAAAFAGCESKPPPDTAAFRVRAVAFPGGAGSAEPRLTTGPNGETVLSWLEPVGDEGVV
jgi:hypothetical protein